METFDNESMWNDVGMQECSFFVLGGGCRGVYNNVFNCAFLFNAFSACILHFTHSKKDLKKNRHLSN